MKYLFLPLLLLLFAVPAHAKERGTVMLLTDGGPNGTDVFEAPGGKAVRSIPHGGKTDAELAMRRVTALEQNGQWFRVRLYDDSTGWMHAEALGSCASATEDGAPALYAKPDDASPEVARVAQGTPLRFVELKDGWAKVETAGPGAKKSGWMMEQTLFANPYNNCWEK